MLSLSTCRYASSFTAVLDPPDGTGYRWRTFGPERAGAVEA